MIILGIADNHDSGAALVVDGELCAAVNQERIDRIKGSGRFPWGAIDAVLDVGGISPAQVDRVVLGGTFTPSILLRLFPEKHQKARRSSQFSMALHQYMIYQSALRRSGFHRWETALCRRWLKRKLSARRFGTVEIQLRDHHQAHADGAYRTQGRDRALVLTLDAMGDGLSATAWLGQQGALRPLGDQSGLSALSLFYSQITEMLGFQANRHEGKITGLAATGEIDKALAVDWTKLIGFHHGAFRRIDPGGRKRRALWEKTKALSRSDVAATAQSVLEEAVTSFVSFWIDQSGCADLALAGGVFANVKLNQAIAEMQKVDSVWVMPHMGDGGLAVGAALGSAGAFPGQMKSAFLGVDFKPNDIHRALERAGARRHRDNPLNRAVDLLASGGIVARCKGPMEWGPRALGNRSIFASAVDPSINDRLNERLDRSEFMPFAPIVRIEDGPRFFHDIEKVANSARFMTVCLRAKPSFATSAPAAVHVDGTARPQFVHREQSPEVHRLLSLYGEKTGFPALINTSLNLHESPIAATADDGVRTWRKAGLDGLLIGDLIAVQGRP